MRLSRTVARGVVAAVTAVLLAGCSGDAGAPEGWAVHEVDGLSLALPDSWVDVKPGAEGWQAGWQDVEGDAATAQVLATSPLSRERYADSAVAALIAPAQVGGLPGFEVSDRREFEVDGATSALRVRFTYAPEGGGTYQGVWFVVADREAAVSAAVQVTGERLADELLVQLERSLVLDAESAPATGGVDS